MRKMATSFLAAGLLVTAFASAAMAGSLLTESFSYPFGNLAGNGGWLNFSGAATDIQVVSGRANGSGPNANDDHTLFTPQSTSSSTYACFQVRIPDPGGQPKSIYFAMLKDAGTSIFVSRVYVLPVAPVGFTFGISYSSTNSSTLGVTPWSATPLLYDTDYIVAIKYDPVTLTSTLWVDPVNELSTNVTNTGTAVAVAVQGFGLRQSATAATLPPAPPYVGTTDWGFSVDNVSVGTSFADACDGLTATKDNSTWGRLKAIYRN